MKLAAVLLGLKELQQIFIIKKLSFHFSSVCSKGGELLGFLAYVCMHAGIHVEQQFMQGSVLSSCTQLEF